MRAATAALLAIHLSARAFAQTDDDLRKRCDNDAQREILSGTYDNYDTCRQACEQLQSDVLGIDVTIAQFEHNTETCICYESCNCWKEASGTFDVGLISGEDEFDFPAECTPLKLCHVRHQLGDSIERSGVETCDTVCLIAHQNTKAYAEVDGECRCYGECPCLVRPQAYDILYDDVDVHYIDSTLVADCPATIMSVDNIPQVLSHDAFDLCEPGSQLVYLDFSTDNAVQMAKAGPFNKEEWERSLTLGSSDKVARYARRRTTEFVLKIQQENTDDRMELMPSKSIKSLDETVTEEAFILTCVQRTPSVFTSDIENTGLVYAFPLDHFVVSAELNAAVVYTFPQNVEAESNPKITFYAYEKKQGGTFKVWHKTTVYEDKDVDTQGTACLAINRPSFNPKMFKLETTGSGSGVTAIAYINMEESSLQAVVPAENGEGLDEVSLSIPLAFPGHYYGGMTRIDETRILVHIIEYDFCGGDGPPAGFQEKETIFDYLICQLKEDVILSLQWECVVEHFDFTPDEHSLVEDFSGCNDDDIVQDARPNYAVLSDGIVAPDSATRGMIKFYHYDNGEFRPETISFETYVIGGVPYYAKIVEAMRHDDETRFYLLVDYGNNGNEKEGNQACSQLGMEPCETDGCIKPTSALHEYHRVDGGTWESAGACSLPFSAVGGTYINTHNLLHVVSRSQDVYAVLGESSLYGGIDAVEVTNGGTGFSVGDTGGLNDGDGEGATYTVTNVDFDGQILEITLKTSGQGYALGETLSFDSAAGTSVTVTKLVACTASRPLQLGHMVGNMPPANFNFVGRSPRISSDSTAMTYDVLVAYEKDGDGATARARKEEGDLDEVGKTIIVPTATECETERIKPKVTQSGRECAAGCADINNYCISTDRLGYNSVGPYAEMLAAANGANVHQLTVAGKRLGLVQQSTSVCNAPAVEESYQRVIGGKAFYTCVIEDTGEKIFDCETDVWEQGGSLTCEKQEIGRLKAFFLTVDKSEEPDPDDDDDNDDDDDDSKLGAGAIVGIVLGSLAGILIAVLLFMKWRERQEAAKISPDQQKLLDNDIL